jgi:hypothetical protein
MPKVELKKQSTSGGTPSNTVSDETTYGIAPNAGISNNYSRGDHTHGSPAGASGGGILLASQYDPNATGGILLSSQYDPTAT